MMIRIQFLRHMRDFFQLTCKVETTQEELQGERKVREGEDDDGESDSGHVFSRETVTLSCVGVGYSIKELCNS